ncbi:hypothetical protein Y032_0053g2366 [Ancylostoma ceylanicum]|uniref:Major sperm protein n=1 Tax=Ancylostoma ceylanicum TaxID=53326 RepID=A0A016U6V1_9BILA|nr:hypothetical protein Y032_0053g2366 [Ancylostoma ceylanicum]
MRTNPRLSDSGEDRYTSFVIRPGSDSDILQGYQKVSGLRLSVPYFRTILKGSCPFTDIVNAHLQLKNPTERPVCFKVKTTAPKQYCVRPNSGVLPPSSSKTITVMLQPMDGVPTDVARHKFMVQTCFCPPGDVDLDNIWKTISPNELMYSKLMVVFQQRTGEHAGAVKEEAPSAVAFTSPMNAGNARPSASPGGNRVAELEEKLRSETELRLKSEKERALLQHDLDELFSKHAKLQQAMQSPEGGTPTIQVILLAIAALLVGLIVGKLF